MTTRTLLNGLLALAFAAAPLLAAPPAEAQSRRPDLDRSRDDGRDRGSRPGLDETPTPRAAQPQRSGPVTSDGFAQWRYGKTFFIQVPMVDEPPHVTSFVAPGPPAGGIGMNITAESIINSVRYAGENPDIQHMVFLMRTGGGKMFHAEAMMHVIEDYHETTEFHIIIDDAISAGTWTAFSCDSIFMVDSGSIGGAVIYITLPDGSVQESAEIPAVAARMAKLAERNGHPGVLLPAMMHKPAELHYWIEDDEPVLSATAPTSSAIRDHDVLDDADSVLTLTSEQAFKIGLAERISGFDGSLVGDQIGAPNWTRANHYGQVIHEIGDIYNVTRFDQDQFEAQLASMPFFRDNRENREHPQIAAILDDREVFELLVRAYDKINDALNNLPYVHPERHIYFMNADGQTILEDPEQWADDVQASRSYTRQLTGALRDIRNAFRKLEYDEDNLGELEDALKKVSDRIDGIARQGNAAYWAENEVDLEIE